MSDAAGLAPDDRPFRTIVRNVATRYLSVAIEIVLGLITLPFNLHHLGTDAYGLWMLTAGITIHFSILDLGYGGAMVKFVAQYRAHRDARALNEIASTLFYLFTAFGLVAYLVAAGLAFNLGHVFALTPAQAAVGKWILLIVVVYVAMNFPFSVYGGVSSGFQRYDINNWVAIVCNSLVAITNIAVVLMGFGLVTLVAATTIVRVAMLIVYRHNAYRVFPKLEIRPGLFRASRLREVTGFSVYSSIIDWANKLNYELDEVVIGVFLGATPIAVWAVADRIISGIQRLTNQANAVLFPVVVDCDARQHTGRLQRLLVEGTRVSLGSVVPMAVLLIVLGDQIVRLWVGPAMTTVTPVLQILAVAVALRVGNSTSTTLLKGAGRVRYVAMVNIVAGICNLVLSAILIQPLGLPGVAIGTLVPIAAASIFVLFPAACRRAQLPLAEAFRRAVWPPVWPAIVSGVTLEVLRRGSGTSVALLVGDAALATVLYVVLFIVAIGPRDREHYLAKVSDLMRRNRNLAPVA